MRHSLPLLLTLVLLTLAMVFLLRRGSEEPGAPDYPEAVWEPAHESNFSESDREANGLRIRWIIIHDVEGGAQAAINWFKDPRAKASSHYIVAYDGTVYQMVKEKDIAWHAGNWAYNEHSIGIEHAGYADRKMYTEEEYRASAKLVAYLIKKYNISLKHPEGLAPADPNRGSGIIGHVQVPDPGDPSVGGGKSHHYDPGVNWDWVHYMELVKQYYEGRSTG
ncbi:MAG: N-acetylmuramoyl-L-alanine amidase [Candidatus Brockarchaeota archaeon]|nr:N-acetylmuramoyl-L-alanine amidase [Candidatus Brockarchaeota archaeon]